MPRTKAVLSFALVAAIGLLIFSERHGSTFEHRAAAAERQSANLSKALAVARHQIDSLTRTVGTQAETVLVAIGAVKAIDSTNPPPAPCAPNLAARDKVIAVQADQILNLSALTNAQARAIALLTQDRDTLKAALAVRPRPVVRLPFLQIDHPKPAVFAGLCLNGRACAGAGFSVPIHVGAP